MRILSPNDPDDAFMLHDIARARREARAPECACCSRPIMSEYYLDLSEFGTSGYVCEVCVDANTHPTDEWGS